MGAVLPFGFSMLWEFLVVMVRDFLFGFEGCELSMTGFGVESEGGRVGIGFLVGKLGSWRCWCMEILFECVRRSLLESEN